jgi:hypothetical protein
VATAARLYAHGPLGSVYAPPPYSAFSGDEHFASSASAFVDIVVIGVPARRRIATRL